ncbi:MAG TPA: hypothetical protein DDZ83_09435 [Nitrospinae bacterium]|nr:hypothetical protein [Nitrospinota bacterium]
MYDRILEGRELSIGVSGKLWKNVLVMYDRQTDTLWSHLLGEGLIGPLKGKRLKSLPSAMMTYAEWKRLFPGTLILKNPTGLFGRLFRSSRDPYEGYYYSSRAGIIPQKYRDTRLHPKTFIVAVALASGGGKKKAKVYPFAELNRAGVVNDVFAGRDLLVSYCESAKSGVVFDRKLDGRVLTFEPGSKNGPGKGSKIGPAGCPVMRDRETGTQWVLLTGAAAEGPLKGKKLRMIPSTQSFWFGWKDYYPKSEIYRHKR